MENGKTNEDTVVPNHDITPDLYLDGPSIHDTADLRVNAEICEIPVDLSLTIKDGLEKVVLDDMHHQPVN
jgi:hypothetical protein